MKTRTWILIFALLLIFSLGAGLWLLMPGEDASRAQIVSNGQVLKTLELAIDQEFTVETESGGYNVITVRDGKIGVTQASCPDHYCMKRGLCSGGREIVCLPNRMTIRFLGEQEIDAVVG